jgi:hypothetical protein
MSHRQMMRHSTCRALLQHDRHHVRSHPRHGVKHRRSGPTRHSHSRS